MVDFTALVLVTDNRLLITDNFFQGDLLWLPNLLLS